MRKVIIALLLLSIGVAKAQNVQTHYDMGKDRGYLTTTVEMFKPDNYGSTFFFIDMDYNGEKNGISLAYWEISRNLKLGKLPVQLHLEYNGGLYIGEPKQFSGSINNSFLTGVSYPLPIKGGSFEVSALYKYIDGITNAADIQFTGVWFVPLFKGKVSFTGFVDFWSQGLGNDNSNWVFLTEPQLWYNATKHLSLGSEVEISNNFIIGSDGIQVMPTLAAKWSF